MGDGEMQGNSTKLKKIDRSCVILYTISKKKGTIQSG